MREDLSNKRTQHDAVVVEHFTGEMNIKVAVFGISRSGKDYSIQDAARLLSEDGSF